MKDNAIINYPGSKKKLLDFILKTSEKYINKHFQGKEKEYKLNKEITRNYQMRKIE